MIASYSRTLVAAAALAVAAGSAWAAPVPLGAITHDYGTGAGQVRPLNLNNPASSCDTLNANMVVVYDTSPSSCSRFNDRFDFSSFDFDSIDRFELTLTYASTNGNIIGIPTEFWYARPATSGTGSANYLNFALARVGGTPTSTTFTIDDSIDVFNGIVTSQAFHLWFAEEGLSNNFNLYSATLTVFGTPTQPNGVPTPGSLALTCLAGLALCVTRRRKV